jgi:hypothetical protein
MSFYDVKFRPASISLHWTRYPKLKMPVAEFAKIPRVGPAVAGQRGEHWHVPLPCFGGISCSGICQNSPRRSGDRGSTVGEHWHVSLSFFGGVSCSGICQNSSRRSGDGGGSGGNIGMFRYHFSGAFPVAEFAKIPRVGPATAGVARGTLACSASIFRDYSTSVTSRKSIPDSPHRFEHPWLPRIVAELFA